jgi:hypothetical protein
MELTEATGLSVSHLRDELRAIRLALREHRDQIGDYRCWVDDHVLYERTLPGYTAPSTPPSEELFDSYCESFFRNRQHPNDRGRNDIPLDSSIGPLVLAYPAELDSDIQELGIPDLQRIIAEARAAIEKHFSKGPLLRTFEDDFSLAMLLPEQRLPDTALPPRELFLGRGCPGYNAHCQAHPDEFASAIWSRQRV